MIYIVDVFSLAFPGIPRPVSGIKDFASICAIIALLISWSAVVRRRVFSQTGAAVAAVGLICITAALNVAMTVENVQRPDWTIHDALTTVISNTICWGLLFNLAFCTLGRVASHLIGRTWATSLDGISLSIAMIGILLVGLHGVLGSTNYAERWGYTALGIAIGLWVGAILVRKYNWHHETNVTDLLWLKKLKQLSWKNFFPIGRPAINTSFIDSITAVALIYFLLAALIASAIEIVPLTPTCEPLQLSYPRWIPLAIPLLAIIAAPVLAIAYIRANRSIFEFVFLIFGLYAFVIFAFAIGFSPLGVQKSGAADGITITDFADYMYYSAVTFTTLGYGDLVPCDGAKFLAAIEAVFGAFMLPFSSAALFLSRFMDGGGRTSSSGRENSMPD